MKILDVLPTVLACLFISAVMAPAANSGGLVTLHKIAPGLYVDLGVHQPLTPENFGAVANLGVIIGDDGVAVVDSGGSYIHGQQLLAAIRSLTALPVRYVINTHMHPDHVFGNQAFAALTPRPVFVGHHKLARALAQRSAFYLENIHRQIGDSMSGTKVVLPDRGVTDRLQLDLGNRPLLLTAHPTAHTDNDLTVLDVETGILFTGDLLFHGHIPIVDGSLRGWLKVSETLAAGNYSAVVPGHGDVLANLSEGLAPQTHYLQRIRSDIRGLLRRGGSLDEAVETVGRDLAPAWQQFDGNHQRNVTAGFAELEWE